MTIIADGVTIPTTSNYIRDDSEGISFETVYADGVLVWRRAPDIPPWIYYPLTAISGDTITISWGGAARAESYSLHGTFPGQAWTKLRDITTSSTTFTVNPVGPYQFAVIANNSGGSSSNFKYGAVLNVEPRVYINMYRMNAHAEKTVSRSGTTWASVDFQTDGSAQARKGSSNTPEDQIGDWMVGNGNSAHYEIMAHANQGWLAEGILDTWLNLGQKRVWKVIATDRYEFCDMRIYIRKNGVVLAECYASISALVRIEGGGGNPDVPDVPG